ncbi:MAG: redoxin domain-containing protein [Vicinamibacterales bacterium]
MPASLFRARVLLLLSLLALPAAAAAQATDTPPAPAAPAAETIVKDTRARIGEGDFEGADRLVRDFLVAHGQTPEGLEALSWIGRGLLAASRLEEALKYAYESERLSLALADTRPLDEETHLPLALGASYEVQAQALARQGDRATAIRVLERALDEFGTTSINARLRKNLNLLTLEGQPAPAWEVDEYIGDLRPPTVAELKGRPFILFLWAHWCTDCRATAPVLAALQQKYKAEGLTIVGLTQRYGYLANSKEPADAPTEMRHIAAMRVEHFSDVDMTVPVSSASFTNYGTSTTPTIVLVDAGGVVRLYHPGRMTIEELEPHVRRILSLD